MPPGARRLAAVAGRDQIGPSPAPITTIEPSMSDPELPKARGLARGLTNYGDREFSLYLRRSFASSMGYGGEMLDRPIIGIAHSASGFNNCHRHVPELIEAV